MRGRPLLLFVGALVNLVIIGLAIRSSNLTHELEAAEAQAQVDQLRMEAAFRLTEEAIDDVASVDPARAKELRFDILQVRGGDPRIISPTPDKDIRILFNEML